MTPTDHKICPHCQQPALWSAPTCGLCGHAFPATPDGPTRSSFITPHSDVFNPPPYSGQTAYPPQPGQAPYSPPHAAPPNAPPASYGQTYAPPNAPYGQQPPYAPYGQPYPVVYTEQKSKVAAALFSFFLGGLGAHGFYTGNTAMGVTILCIWLISWPLIILFGLGLLGLFAVHVICLVQTILYLTASDHDFQQKYVVEKRWF